jgi:hypothetical protein
VTSSATLVTDGSSDAALLPVLRWLLGEVASDRVDLRWADLRSLRTPPKLLRDRLAAAIEYYPCDLLFVHRDAEHPDRLHLRREEIDRANETGVRHICVVPVRMLESWMLFDERALREAAGRPSGRERLDLPGSRSWATIADAKGVLHGALRAASGATGRRARQFDPDAAVHRLSNLIHDWGPLRQLPAFQQLEREVRQAFGAPSDASRSER